MARTLAAVASCVVGRCDDPAQAEGRPAVILEDDAAILCEEDDGRALRG
jgi:hypothetical protein